MRLCRFYQSGDLSEGTSIALSKEVSAHISRVLRLKVDTEIQLFNGDGNNYKATLLSVGKVVKATILSSTETKNESPLKIHLGQAISRGEKMDFTLQKAVELGVHAVTPLITERVQFRFDEKRMIKKMQHWQKIIESASEQSGRSYLMQLNQPIILRDWLAAENTQGLVFTPNATLKLNTIKGQSSLRILIGPEGGLSDDEVTRILENSDFTSMTLGPRILRTETAALTAISILQSQLGDI